MSKVNCVPSQSKVFPYKKSYNCPISNQIKINKYRSLVDYDPVENQIYIELGYDDRHEYDSSFFMHPNDALDLGNAIVKAAKEAMIGYDKVRKSIDFIDHLNILLKNHAIKSLSITPIELYTKDVEDSLFGCMIMDVSYTVLGDETRNMILLSESYGNDDTIYDNIVKDMFNKYQVVVSFDIDKFKLLISELVYLVRKGVDSNKNLMKDKVEYMIPKTVQSIADMAKEISSKINKSNKGE